MTRALVALGLVASVMVLAGCGAAPPLPEPLTQAEVKQRIADSQAEWWNSMFPDEPQPVVDVVAYLSPDSASNRINQCMEEADIEGVTFGEDSIMAVGDTAIDQLNRVQFICIAQYPIKSSAAAYLSDEEGAWLIDFNRSRLVPCLQLLGYTVLDRRGDGFGTPYFDLEPTPSLDEWTIIDSRCPPAPIGPDYSPYRPTRD